MTNINIFIDMNVIINNINIIMNINVVELILCLRVTSSPNWLIMPVFYYCH